MIRMAFTTLGALVVLLVIAVWAWGSPAPASVSLSDVQDVTPADMKFGL